MLGGKQTGRQDGEFIILDQGAGKGLTEMVTRGEGLHQLKQIWGRAFQAEGTASANALRRV